VADSLAEDRAGTVLGVVREERQVACPRPESNQRTRFRKPLLYPLSYGGSRVTIAKRLRCARLLPRLSLAGSLEGLSRYG
jgi:hypothetical protein